jgi:hypothetical protein
MTNPWLKKNPYMSMWLSGANAVAGSMRGHAAAQVKRHTATTVNAATQEIFKAWSGALLMQPPAVKRRKSRR